MEMKSTVLGAGVGAVLFAAVGLYRSAVVGSGPFAHLEPVAFFAVIGGTVGGLAGPLARGILRRWSGKGDSA
ncbi:MAG: hypothetical protein HY704_13875 [Gemmatimonadetes bacterium]|nr:hypothetical protein [Gemmatimonadota bacterium]